MPTPIDRDKLRTIGVLRGGRTRPVVSVTRDATGRLVQATTDELGNTVTERATGQDVTVRPATVRLVGTIAPVADSTPEGQR